MKSYTAVALATLTLVGASAPSQITPVATYGEDRSFGGSFALHEIVLGDAKPQLKAIQETALAAHRMIISEASDSKFPKTAPVALITAGANISDVPIDRKKTAAYLENGGMLIIDCRDSKAGEKMRGWLQSVVPNRPLLDASIEKIVPEWWMRQENTQIQRVYDRYAQVVQIDDKIRAAVIFSNTPLSIAE